MSHRQMDEEKRLKQRSVRRCPGNPGASCFHRSSPKIENRDLSGRGVAGEMGKTPRPGAGGLQWGLALSSKETIGITCLARL